MILKKYHVAVALLILTCSERQVSKNGKIFLENFFFSTGKICIENIHSLNNESDLIINLNLYYKFKKNS